MNLGWLRAPLDLLAVFTAAKSFVDNPILGSPRLNRLGLHIWRLKTAHALARLRRHRLAHLVATDLREQFDRDGVVVIRDLIPEDEFGRLQRAILETALECREQQQGDTITRRVPIGTGLRRRFPELDALLESSRWKGLMAYVGSTRSEPLYYIQTIFGGVADGPPDPQLELHADTFHPSLKAWFFLTDVGNSGRPFTYVAGSHRLSAARIEWEKRKSETVVRDGDRLSQRGSFRVLEEEIEQLGLPRATKHFVPANTLVVADTCGFHARGDASQPTVRVEIWAYSRRSPFLPWTGFDLLSWWPLSQRRAEWALAIADRLDRWGVRKQHWRPAGPRRALEP